MKITVIFDYLRFIGDPDNNLIFLANSERKSGENFGNLKKKKFFNNLNLDFGEMDFGTEKNNSTT